MSFDFKTFLLERNNSRGLGKLSSDGFKAYVNRVMPEGSDNRRQFSIHMYFSVGKVPLLATDADAAKRAHFLKLTKDYHAGLGEASSHQQLKNYTDLVSDYETFCLPWIKEYKKLVTGAMIINCLEKEFGYIFSAIHDNVLMVKRDILYSPQLLSACSIDQAFLLVRMYKVLASYAIEVAMDVCDIDFKGKKPKLTIKDPSMSLEGIKIQNFPKLWDAKKNLPIPINVEQILALSKAVENEDMEKEKSKRAAIALRAAGIHSGLFIDPLRILFNKEYRIGSRNPTERHLKIMKSVHFEIYNLIVYAETCGLPVRSELAKTINFHSSKKKDEDGVKQMWLAVSLLNSVIAQFRAYLNSGSFIAKPSDPIIERGTTTVSDEDEYNYDRPEVEELDVEAIYNQFLEEDIEEEYYDAAEEPEKKEAVDAGKDVPVPKKGDDQPAVAAAPVAQAPVEPPKPADAPKMKEAAAVVSKPKEAKAKKEPEPEKFETKVLQDISSKKLEKVDGEFYKVFADRHRAEYASVRRLLPAQIQSLRKAATLEDVDRLFKSIMNTQKGSSEKEKFSSSLFF